MLKNLPFSAADILLPKSSPEKWAVIACDQFTSEPEYWSDAENTVKDSPSALKIILPEVYLNDPDVDKYIKNINSTMLEYLNGDVFTEYKDALIYTERTLSDGRCRRGLVGKFDLSAYDYDPDKKPLIRTTEGTVLSRIPPRVKIRRDAALEAPHVMILMDDAERSVIEKIDVSGMEPIYDFDLMLGGGHLRGYLLGREEQKRIFDALSALAGDDDEPMLFAVGDGNHSLATAKASAPLIGTEQAGYALAELVNIHDEALDFEPIYRVVFGVDVTELEKALKTAFPDKTGREVKYLSAKGGGTFFADGLESKVLQDFLDAYTASHPGAEIDYIHGIDSLKALAVKENAMGFLFGGITKSELFPYVKKNGPLPRKTFSMGEARDKRYYMECRRIR